MIFSAMKMVMVNGLRTANARSNKKTRTDMFGGRFTASMALHPVILGVHSRDLSSERKFKKYRTTRTDKSNFAAVQLVKAQVPRWRLGGLVRHTL